MSLPITEEELEKATREQLQEYLEACGFAVYASEGIERLRLAAVLHMLEEE